MRLPEAKPHCCAATCRSGHLRTATRAPSNSRPPTKKVLTRRERAFQVVVRPRLRAPPLRAGRSPNNQRFESAHARCGETAGMAAQKKPLLARERAFSNGGQTQNRTGDTRIFSPLLYRLSYLASLEKGGIKCSRSVLVNRFFTFFRIHCFFLKECLFRAKFKQVFVFPEFARLILRTVASPTLHHDRTHSYHV